MSNHKSAVKRAKQSFKRNQGNKVLLTKIRTNLNKITANLDTKDEKVVYKSLKSYTSVLARAVKRGLIKKRNASIFTRARP